MKQKLLSRCIVGLLCSLGSYAVFAGPVVQTAAGEVEGVSANKIDSFKGIPFAKPPVGELRWRAPQPVSPWKGVFQANQYGHDCMQKPFPSDAAPLGTTPAEDCLVLNVWKPTQASEQLRPVMVWIYGGGFVNGGASPAVYDASEFAQQGIVAVSFNYRLGRFGFFAHPALVAEGKQHPQEALGNYGFMDQIAALKWVKENIKQFGGDPEKVTIVGESAGGFSNHVLLNSPLAKGLFSQAIIQSGLGRQWENSKRLDAPLTDVAHSAQANGVAFAEKWHIKGDDSKALAQLRALPASSVVDDMNMMNMNNPTYSGPMIDGKVMVKQPQSYYSAGQNLDVPIMVGANNADIGFAPVVKTTQEALASFGSDHYQAALAAYESNGLKAPQAIAQALASDKLMVEPARYVAQQAANQGGRAYLYRFSYVADEMKSQWPGAFHATDIPYTFNTVKAKYGDQLTANDQAMAKMVNHYWVNFIKTGSPNSADLPTWDAFDPNIDNLMVFSGKGVKQTQMMIDPWKARLDLVQAIQP